MTNKYYKKIFDPYQWMPGYGENDVIISSSRDGVKITVRYDGKDDEEEEFSVLFNDVSVLCKSSFPGARSIERESTSDTDKTFSFGELMEFVGSDLAREWERYWKDTCRLEHHLHHHVWTFLSENIKIEIISEDIPKIQPPDQK